MGQNNSGCTDTVKAAIIGAAIAGVCTIIAAFVTIFPSIINILSTQVANVNPSTSTPTLQYTSTPSATLDIPSIVGTLDSQATAQQATLNAESTSAARATEFAVGTQSIVNQTETATLWTATPTANITASIEAYRMLQGQTATSQYFEELTRTATLWTKTPTAIFTPTSTPLPKNGLIAFQKNGEIYTIKEDGSELTYLTVGKDPAWSPSGKRIVYISDNDGSIKLYSMDTQGGSSFSFSGDAIRIPSAPNWSLDGKQIVFSSGSNGNWDIYATSANGINIRRLTSTREIDYNPHWSPDSMQIVFESLVGTDRNIYVMNADGSNTRPLTDSPAVDQSPAWSPDGKSILFVSHRYGNADLFLMGIDGSKLTRLTSNTVADSDPAWSPDGTQIVFVSEYNENKDIYIMNLATREISQLTSFTSDDTSPSWQPIPWDATPNP
jgi:dipeptidyl aminopeptidase/acylaminoacyl peptidase